MDFSFDSLHLHNIKPATNGEREHDGMHETIEWDEGE